MPSGELKPFGIALAITDLRGMADIAAGSELHGSCAYGQGAGFPHASFFPVLCNRRRMLHPGPQLVSVRALGVHVAASGREDVMVFVSGRVSRLLRDSEGQVGGMVLDGGEVIRFSRDLGRQLAPIVSEGCLVGVEGAPHFDSVAENYLQAIRVTNLETSERAILPTPTYQGKPGMQSSITPAETASLVHTDRQTAQKDNSSGSHLPENSEEPESDVADKTVQVLHPASFFRALLREAPAEAADSVKNEAARSIGFAYDSLHRIQAILAYLHIIKHRVPGISQFLDEAKHTYEQALSRFAAGDFAGGKEFAEASGSLSRVVEIVMGRTLRSDSSIPSLVPPPPPHENTSSDPDHVEEDLAQAETVLSRIHWLLENGTLPSEDRAQVRKIASWGDAFFKQARRTYRNAVLEDAAEFAQAALAGAHSAEHVCRKWYVSHPARP